MPLMFGLLTGLMTSHFPVVAATLVVALLAGVCLGISRRRAAG